MNGYPLIDLKRGVSVQGVLAGLTRMPEMWFPNFVPRVTIIRDPIQYMIKANMTLEQVKAAKPTEDWDPRFGTNAAWTPDMFVEAVYKSLEKSSVQTK